MQNPPAVSVLYIPHKRVDYTVNHKQCQTASLLRMKECAPAHTRRVSPLAASFFLFTSEDLRTFVGGIRGTISYEMKNPMISDAHIYAKLLPGSR